MQKPRRNYGNKEIAARLREARELAGFRSAREAAIAFAWPETTYRAHESAARKIHEQDLERYGDAFQVMGDWFSKTASRSKHGQDLPAHDRTAAADREQPDQQLLARLRLARRLSGFRTAKEAANNYGWKRSTYYAHENGQNRISKLNAKVYAAAFGISDSWLWTGESRSGLGPAFDKLIRKRRPFPLFYDDRDFGTLLDFSDERRRGSLADISNLEQKLLQREEKLARTDAIKPMIVLREQSADLIPATSSAQNFDRRKRPLTHGMIWGIPTNAPDALWKASTNNLIVIAVSHSDASLGVFAGDRIIVDRNQQNQDVEGTYVFLDKHKLSFTNGDIIGRVIAKIVRV
jgi:hypothetical protein